MQPAAASSALGQNGRSGALDRVAPVAALIACGMLVRLALGAILGLDFMESYGAVVARFPSWSYFDQPPLTWWLIGATTRLFGTESALVVRLPFILVFAGSTWLLYGLTERLFTPRAAFFAAAAYTFAPLFGLYDATLAQTDSLLEFFCLAAALCLSVALFDSHPRRAGWAPWLGAGFLFGCAMASKYSAVLLVPGLLAFLLTGGPEQRRWLGRPQPYAAAVVALVPLLPVFLWNAQHGWVSFLYQGDRASWGNGLHAARAVRWLLTQVAILQPWIFLALAAGLIGSLAAGPRRRPSWFLCCLAVLPVVLFPGVMLWSSHPLRGFHWGALGFMLLIPLGGDWIDRLADRHPRLASGWLALSAAVYGLLALGFGSHALTGWITRLAPARAFARQDPILLEFFDWTDVPKILRARGFDPSRTFLTATRWEECAKAGYAAEGAYRLLCLSSDNIHFSFIATPADFAGQDAVVVDRYASLANVVRDLDGHFASIEALPPIPLTFHGRPIMMLNAYLAKGFDGSWVVAKPGAGPRQ